jgi:quinol monooxygenase YgiN
MKHAVIGTVEVKPGARDKVLRAVLAHRERSLRDEPGTIQFEVLVPNEDPSKLHLFELYADTPAFFAHMKGASMVKVTQEVGHLVVSLSGIQSKLGTELAASAA